MRQTFTFADSRHKPPQAVAALKNRVRKYIKREARKEVPAGFDYWDFDCKLGHTEDAAVACKVGEVITGIGAAFEAGSPTVYVEILARPAARTRKERG